jgi:hypothetical protein
MLAWLKNMCNAIKKFYFQNGFGWVAKLLILDFIFSVNFKAKQLCDHTQKVFNHIIKIILAF